MLDVDPAILSALPTDSLYKFMALAGLLIVVGTLALYLYARRKYCITAYELERDIKIVAARLNASGAAQGSLDWTIAKAESDCGTKKAGYLLAEFRIIQWLHWIWVLAGLALLITGARLWYVKLQRHIDAIHEAQAVQAKIQAAKPCPCEK